ncbi:MAG: hypothetical protein KJP18_12015 [Gemmatimonadetes bacterium]|nr:hypothetical protein [Gemmatimonadota bacterium]
MLLLLAGPFAATLLIGACGGSSSGDSMSVVRDSIGDTLIVRTVSGSEWGGAEGQLVPEVSVGVLDGPVEQIFGSIRSLAVGANGTLYVMDGQVPAVRVFEADGAYRTTLGRSGGGPGEFGSPDGGMAILSDGRLAVRDPGNARLQIFDANGEASQTWPVVAGGFHTSSPMKRTAGDTLWTPVLMDREVDVSDWQMGLQRVAPDGAVTDTVAIPESGYQTPRIEARIETDGGANVSMNAVPFSPDEASTLHPDGWFIHGISDRYAFTLLRPGGYIRIERDATPTSVTAGEKAEAEAEATRNMRSTDPNWRWNGPGIPDVKPAYDEIYTAMDGRIWVLVELEAVEQDDPDYDPTDPDAIEDRWRSRYAFDLFETDGTYVGRVPMPEDVSRYPRPLIRGDQVWAVTRDDLDVQRVVRYRLVPPGVGTD